MSDNVTELLKDHWGKALAVAVVALPAYLYFDGESRVTIDYNGNKADEITDNIALLDDYKPWVSNILEEEIQHMAEISRLDEEEPLLIYEKGASVDGHSLNTKNAVYGQHWIVPVFLDTITVNVKDQYLQAWHLMNKSERDIVFKSILERIEQELPEKLDAHYAERKKELLQSVQKSAPSSLKQKQVLSIK